jgi:hypothetical protein
MQAPPCFPLGDEPPMHLTPAPPPRRRRTSAQLTRPVTAGGSTEIRVKVGHKGLTKNDIFRLALFSFRKVAIFLVFSAPF